MRYLLALILSTSILFTGIVGCSSTATNQIEDVVLATSGENTLLVSEYLYYFGGPVAQQEMLLQMFGFSEDDIIDYWTDESQGVSQEQITKLNALEHALDNAILYILATEAGYTYDPEILQLIEDDVDEFVIQVTTPETRGDQEFYNMFRVTPEEYKNMQKMELTIDAYVESIFNDISVSEEEMLNFYEENIERVQQVLPFHATARHVLIASNDDMTEEEREDATERANDILRRVQEGEDITNLAIEYSEDPGVEVNDGEYRFHRGEMVAPFEEWAFSAQPGDIGMVQSQFGYHIMYSVDVDTIDELWDDIYEDLEYLTRESMLPQIVRDLIEGSDIIWDLDEDVYETIRVMQ